MIFGFIPFQSIAAGSEANFIFAIYTGDGKLKFAENVPVQIGDGLSFGTLKFNHDLAENPDEEIKLFLWDINNVPLSEPIITMSKSGGEWTYTKVSGVDVILAYKPLSLTGADFPAFEITQLHRPNGNNSIRVVISI
jgi:hypothetical protein